MNRSEWLQSVSKRIGIEVKFHHLVHAQKLGLVRKAPLVGGWQRFDKHHADELLRYMKTQSRSSFKVEKASEQAKNSGRNRAFHIANRVFTWLENGDGTRMNSPNCISGDGTIVAGSGTTTTSDQVACYRSKIRGVVPFQSFVPGSQLTTGLQLTDCSGVSLDGQTFTGTGMTDGRKKVSWVMTFPRTEKR